MLFALTLATAVGGVITAAWYWQLRRTALAALIVLHESQGEFVQPAKARYWSLDKRAKIVALINMACWFTTMMGFALFDQNAELIPWVWQRLLVVVPSTLSMWGIVIIAEVFNSRESTQRDRWWQEYYRRWRD